MYLGYAYVCNLEDAGIVLVEVEYVGWLGVPVTAVDVMKVSQGGREPGQLFDGPDENGRRSVRCRLVFPKLLQVPVISP